MAKSGYPADCELAFPATPADGNLNGEYVYSFKVVTFTIIYDAPNGLRVVGVHNYTDDSRRVPRTGIDRMRRES